MGSSRTMCVTAAPTSRPSRIVVTGGGVVLVGAGSGVFVVVGAGALGVDDDALASGTTPFGSGTVRSGRGNASGSISGRVTPAAARPDDATSRMAAGSSRSDTCSISVLEIFLLSTSRVSPACGPEVLAITANGLATTATAMAARAIECFGRG